MRVVFGKLIEVGRVGSGCRCFARKVRRPGWRPHKASEGFQMFFSFNMNVSARGLAEVWSGLVTCINLESFGVY